MEIIAENRHVTKGSPDRSSKRLNYLLSTVPARSCENVAKLNEPLTMPLK